MQKAALIYILLIFSLTTLGIHFLFNTTLSLGNVLLGVVLIATAYLIARKYEWFSARFGFVIYSPGVSMNALSTFYGQDTTTRVKVFTLLALTMMGFPFAAYLFTVHDYLGALIITLIMLLSLRALVKKLSKVTGKLLPEEGDGGTSEAEEDTHDLDRAYPQYIPLAREEIKVGGGDEDDDDVI